MAEILLIQHKTLSNQSIILIHLFLTVLYRGFLRAFMITICPLSTIVVVVVANCPHILLLLQNHWANFNQTWHKASLGEGDSSLFK